MSNALTIIESLLKSNLLHEVSYRGMTTTVYKSENLSKHQIGFSISENGENLVGEKHGAWNKNWIVIGKESFHGDPFFIDSSSSELPVYTAAVGEKIWDPLIVSPSFENFIESLHLVDQFSKKKSAPTEDDELDLLDQLEDLNEESECYFWEDWIVDSEDET